MCAALLVAVATSAGAQNYPTERITFVVGFPAGGFADGVARLVGEHLSKVLGQQVIVENQGGAASNIATHAVATAKPDGYTVLVTTTAIAINATMYKKLNYSIADLTPVALPVQAPETLTVHPSKPKTLKNFLAMAKGKEITFASAGIGSGSFLSMHYFLKDIAKVKAAHVPFKGGGPATQAAIGNQVDSLAATLSGNTAAQVKAGKLVCLGVAAAARFPTLPDCPTFAEGGFPGFEAASWVGFFVPAKTDGAVVAKLNSAINSILDDAPTRAKLSANGTLTKRSPADTASFLRSEVENWRKMVLASGVSVD
jgi:tripartite-type tricarboxylate transporter receptor subunit TctC